MELAGRQGVPVARPALQAELVGSPGVLEEPRAQLEPQAAQVEQRVARYPAQAAVAAS